jgi:hypothetical protein
MDAVAHIDNDKILQYNDGLQKQLSQYDAIAYRCKNGLAFTDYYIEIINELLQKARNAVFVAVVTTHKDSVLEKIEYISEKDRFLVVDSGALEVIKNIETCYYIDGLFRTIPFFTPKDVNECKHQYMDIYEKTYNDDGIAYLARFNSIFAQFRKAKESPIRPYIETCEKFIPDSDEAVKKLKLLSKKVSDKKIAIY